MGDIWNVEELISKSVEWIEANKEWLFSGAGLAFLTVIVGLVIKKRKKSVSPPTQSAGANASQFQGGQHNSPITVVNNSGISVEEARQIASDVAKAEMHSLTAEALDTYRSRNDIFADLLISKLLESDENSLEAFKRPDFQMTYHEAQKQYGKTGEVDLGETLIALIEKVSRETDPSFKRVVLEESVNTVAKLNDEQISTLAMIFLIVYTRRNGTFTQAQFLTNCENVGVHFKGKIAKSNASFQHLEYARCISINSMQQRKAENMLMATYPMLFQEGISPDDNRLEVISPELRELHITKCLNNEDHVQLSFDTEDNLKKICENAGIEEKNILALINIFNTHISVEKFREIVGKGAPNYLSLIDEWNGSTASNCSLTSVGIAIGAGRAEKSFGVPINLDIWIN